MTDGCFPTHSVIVGNELMAGKVLSAHFLGGDLCLSLPAVSYYHFTNLERL